MTKRMNRTQKTAIATVAIQLLADAPVLSRVALRDAMYSAAQMAGDATLDAYIGSRNTKALRRYIVNAMVKAGRNS